jgi:hypothetical protein
VDKNALNTVRDTRKRLGGISQEGFYRLVRAGELRLVKIGRRSYVADSEIDRFIAEGGTSRDAAA